MTKKTGYIPSVIDSTHYIMGSATSLSKDLLQADGQWTPYLPSEEVQREYDIETDNCTSFATTNCIETLFNKIYGTPMNASDRALGIFAGTVPPGNDPHTVIEAARKKGLVKEELLPFDSRLASIDEYFSYIYGDEEACKTDAQDFLSKYQLGHEWVFTSPLPKEVRTSLMKQSLQYSPLGVSVTAWYEKDSVYVDYGQPNCHWTTVYGWNDEGWLCFDSYDPFKKVISFDHNIECVKRYSITPISKKKENCLFGLIKKLWQ